MKLTQYSDYSLRVLIYLGVNPDDRLSTITEISSSYDISRNHVVKVVHNLGQLGYIETIRGKNGGMRLAMKPEDINVGKLIRKTEANLDIVECFGEDGNCVLTPTCQLRWALDEALTAFLVTLDRYTLADLIKPKKEIQAQIINILPAKSAASQKPKSTTRKTKK